MNFQGAHILSINQFEKQDVTRIFDVADQMQPYALRKKVTRVLEGAILGNMFFEASTRTRVSFGSAFNLLGGFPFLKKKNLRVQHLFARKKFDCSLCL